jgi:hypothetical protein
MFRNDQIDTRTWIYGAIESFYSEAFYIQTFLHQNQPTTSTPSTTTRPSTFPLCTKTPIILASKPIMQRLNPLSLLALAQTTLFTSNLEESRRRFHKPLGLDGRHVVHVLASRLDQTMVDDVLGGFAKQRRRRVQVDGRAFHQRLVAFCGIFASGIAEEA